MYEKFISDFEHRINPLSLVEICLPIVRQFPGLYLKNFLFFYLTRLNLINLDGTSAINFLNKLKEKVKHELEAQILISTAIGAIYLEAKDLDQAKVNLEIYKSSKLIR